MPLETRSRAVVYALPLMHLTLTQLYYIHHITAAWPDGFII